MNIKCSSNLLQHVSAVLYGHHQAGVKIHEFDFCLTVHHQLGKVT